ncbi:hypothetical protein FSW04_21955 [Baekduia soli]|uniref:EfeO-type cupredoxin-like domain-containing protein n=1 Tax=Baekduia soli TaxID=496014 RepID=A0A5B8U9W0_9ACTN|nr:hypothetical protein [Baekduia soli]QEC49966.1 hypothetical protein FSW04_21955 [Baekduia soli]
MTPRARIAILVLAVVALVVAFVVARGSDDSSPATATAPEVAVARPAPATTGATIPAATTQTAPKAPAIPVVQVVDARPKGGVKRLSFTRGDTIRFRVRSDTADEIHVHGYDVHADVGQGGSASFTIPGRIEGRFVVELEGHATQIAELEVTP